MATDIAGPRVRHPVASGSFYPRSPAALRASVDALLAAAESSGQRSLTRPHSLRGVVVPHAGYEYSGPIAATAYALLADQGHRPSHVVIIGPSHFEALRGSAVPTHEAWLTPLGEVPIDERARQTALARGAIADDRPHRSEHSIEVQLPFIGCVWPDTPVLPIAVGSVSPDAGAEMLAAIVPEDAMLVVSSDLSHYHDADTADRLDARSAAAIEALDDTSLGPEQACGYDALRVAIAWARSLGLQASLLDLRNSSDTGGDAISVVGYGSFALEGSAAGSRSPASAG